MYDVVLASDLTYMEDLAPLLRALVMHTAPNGIGDSAQQSVNAVIPRVVFVVLLSYEQRNLQAENLLVRFSAHLLSYEHLVDQFQHSGDCAETEVQSAQNRSSRHSRN